MADPAIRVRDFLTGEFVATAFYSRVKQYPVLMRNVFEALQANPQNWTAHIHASRDSDCKDGEMTQLEWENGEWLAHVGDRVTVYVHLVRRAAAPQDVTSQQRGQAVGGLGQLTGAQSRGPANGRAAASSLSRIPVATRKRKISPPLVGQEVDEEHRRKHQSRVSPPRHTYGSPGNPLIHRIFPFTPEPRRRQRPVPETPRTGYQISEQLAARTIEEPRDTQVRPRFTERRRPTSPLFEPEDGWSNNAYSPPHFDHPVTGMRAVSQTPLDSEPSASKDIDNESILPPMPARQSHEVRQKAPANEQSEAKMQLLEDIRKLNSQTLASMQSLLPGDKSDDAVDTGLRELNGTAGAGSGGQFNPVTAPGPVPRLFRHGSNSSSSLSDILEETPWHGLPHNDSDDELLKTPPPGWTKPQQASGDEEQVPSHDFHHSSGISTPSGVDEATEPDTDGGNKRVGKSVKKVEEWHVEER